MTGIVGAAFVATGTAPRTPVEESIMNLRSNEQPQHPEFRALLARIGALVVENDRLDLENGGLRQQVLDLKAELCLARHEGVVA